MEMISGGHHLQNTAEIGGFPKPERSTWLSRECAVCYCLPIRGHRGGSVSLLHGQAYDVRRQKKSW